MDKYLFRSQDTDSTVIVLPGLIGSVDTHGNLKLDVDGAPPVRLNNAQAIALARFVVENLDIVPADLFK